MIGARLFKRMNQGSRYCNSGSDGILQDYTSYNHENFLARAKNVDGVPGDIHEINWMSCDFAHIFENIFLNMCIYRPDVVKQLLSNHQNYIEELNPAMATFSDASPSDGKRPPLHKQGSHGVTFSNNLKVVDKNTLSSKLLKNGTASTAVSSYEELTPIQCTRENDSFISGSSQIRRKRSSGETELPKLNQSHSEIEMIRKRRVKFSESGNHSSTQEINTLNLSRADSPNYKRAFSKSDIYGNGLSRTKTRASDGLGLRKLVKLVNTGELSPQKSLNQSMDSNRPSAFKFPMLSRKADSTDSTLGGSPDVSISKQAPLAWRLNSKKVEPGKALMRQREISSSGVNNKVEFILQRGMRQTRRLELSELATL
eukprot:CAMPEP_0114990498 /NCGR_PEP_ID=MMETSP0216-20121206/10834_1 /TAXON_ID=223996 /ORGANISM="Protocruzia adherens, Strain Boccale" /LENGTH=369 /DNA_ID=CAMNT_0002353689 /DNA_START=122 /DNA_END=1231 /DNA_ORIENTATION=-